jgi:hypothetical protein
MKNALMLREFLMDLARECWILYTKKEDNHNPEAEYETVVCDLNINENNQVQCREARIESIEYSQPIISSAKRMMSLPVGKSLAYAVERGLGTTMT